MKRNLWRVLVVLTTIWTLFCVALWSFGCYACVRAIMREVYIPYGKWENANMSLNMDTFPRHTRERFSGTYVENGVEIDIYIFIWDVDKNFWIFRASDTLPNGGGGRPLLDLAIYSGGYNLRGEDQLRLGLDRRTRERTGQREIILERVGECAVT